MYVCVCVLYKSIIIENAHSFNEVVCIDLTHSCLNFYGSHFIYALFYRGIFIFVSPFAERFHALRSVCCSLLKIVN